MRKRLIGGAIFIAITGFNNATVTIDGTTEEISLHSHKFRNSGMFGPHSRGFGRKG